MNPSPNDVAAAVGRAVMKPRGDDRDQMLVAIAEGIRRKHEAAQKAIADKRLTVFIPIRTRTPGNGRRHWRVDWQEAKKQRQAAGWALMSFKNHGALPAFPVRVKFTRVSVSELDPQNMPGAMKHIIDGIADVYGVNDRDKRWRFEYEQEKLKRKDKHKSGVRIDIESV